MSKNEIFSKIENSLKLQLGKQLESCYGWCITCETICDSIQSLLEHEYTDHEKIWIERSKCKYCDKGLDPQQLSKDFCGSFHEYLYNYDRIFNAF